MNPHLARLATLTLCGLWLTGCALPPHDQSEPESPSPAADVAPDAYPLGAIPEPQDQVALQTGRYTYVPVKPRLDQLNPLLTIIDVHIPKAIITVHDSAEYLLQFSGYRLSHTTPVNTQVSALEQQWIPEAHRHFSNVILRDALITLAGQGYRLLVDPIKRVVAYERDPDYTAKTVTETKPEAP